MSAPIFTLVFLLASLLAWDLPAASIDCDTETEKLISPSVGVVVVKDRSHSNHNHTELRVRQAEHVRTNLANRTARFHGELSNLDPYSPQRMQDQIIVGGMHAVFADLAMRVNTGPEHKSVVIASGNTFSAEVFGGHDPRKGGRTMHDSTVDAFPENTLAGPHDYGVNAFNYSGIRRNAGQHPPSSSTGERAALAMTTSRSDVSLNSKVTEIVSREVATAKNPAEAAKWPSGAKWKVVMEVPSNEGKRKETLFSSKPPILGLGMGQPRVRGIFADNKSTDAKSQEALVIEQVQKAQRDPDHVGSVWEAGQIFNAPRETRARFAKDPVVVVGGGDSALIALDQLILANPLPRGQQHVVLLRGALRPNSSLYKYMKDPNSPGYGMIRVVENVSSRSFSPKTGNKVDISWSAGSNSGQLFGTRLVMASGYESRAHDPGGVWGDNAKPVMESVTAHSHFYGKEVVVGRRVIGFHTEINGKSVYVPMNSREDGALLVGPNANNVDRFRTESDRRFFPGRFMSTAEETAMPSNGSPDSLKNTGPRSRALVNKLYPEDTTNRPVEFSNDLRGRAVSGFTLPLPQTPAHLRVLEGKEAPHRAMISADANIRTIDALDNVSMPPSQDGFGPVRLHFRLGLDQQINVRVEGLPLEGNLYPQIVTAFRNAPEALSALEARLKTQGGSHILEANFKQDGRLDRSTVRAGAPYDYLMDLHQKAHSSKRDAEPNHLYHLEHATPVRAFPFVSSRKDTLEAMRRRHVEMSYRRATSSPTEELNVLPVREKSGSLARYYLVEDGNQERVAVMHVYGQDRRDVEGINRGYDWLLGADIMKRIGLDGHMEGSPIEVYLAKSPDPEDRNKETATNLLILSHAENGMPLNEAPGGMNRVGEAMGILAKLHSRGSENTEASSKDFSSFVDARVSSLKTELNKRGIPESEQNRLTTNYRRFLESPAWTAITHGDAQVSNFTSTASGVNVVGFYDIPKSVRFDNNHIIGTGHALSDVVTLANSSQKRWSQFNSHAVVAYFIERGHSPQRARELAKLALLPEEISRGESIPTTFSTSGL